jgi:hypothetical protein
MTKFSAITRLGQVAALALTLAAPALATAAYADDEFGVGSQQEALIRRAADGSGVSNARLSAEQQKALESEFATGQNGNFSTPHTASAQLLVHSPVDIAQARSMGWMGYYASDGGFRPDDLIGSGGHQDAVALEIFHPGSGTDF